MGKVKILTIKEKYEAILMVKIKKIKVNEVAKHFDCGKSQIYEALKNKKDIINMIQKNKNTTKKKIRKDINESLNNVVYEWFCESRSKNVRVSGPMLQKKAKEIALEMNITNFNASNGWLQSFKANRQIVFHTISGESSDVDSNLVINWKHTLTEKTEGYEIRNIGNLDETGLFFRMLPNNTMNLKRKKCHGGKKSKERLSILLTVFADGTILKPLVIGKSSNPRCFKNINKSDLPVIYKANSKAWMTANIFLEYLLQLNKQMMQENRKILLFLDNATCHPKINLSNIKLEFLPPNCTSNLQPLNSGIIYCLKVNYRKLMLKKIITYMNSCENTSDLIKGVDILEAIVILDKSLKMISGSCIKNCFNKCGFQIQNDEDYVIELNELQDLIILHAESSGKNLESILVNADDYVAIDNDILTETDDIDITSLIQTSNNRNSVSEDEIKIEDDIE